LKQVIDASNAMVPAYGFGGPGPMNFFFRMNPGGSVGAVIAGAALAMLTSMRGPAAAAGRSDRVARAEAALEAWRMDEAGAMLAGQVAIRRFVVGSKRLTMCRWLRWRTLIARQTC